MKTILKSAIKLLTTVIILSSFTAVYAQKGTNVLKLQELSEKFKLKWEQENRQARSFANKNGIPFRFETDKGAFFELQSVKDGVPMYYMTENANSSATISTDKVNSGGTAGLNLDGQGMTVHEWDGGAVLSTHQEYSGRVVMGDGVTTTHYHSTHVAGTMIASGVQAAAKGMAPAANLRAFDWNSDESEMATEATNGALVSNHSYGYGRGWVWSGTNWSWYGNTSISTQEDYLFGFYDSQAQDWDQIAYNAPYYLIVKSAGNDRGDGPTNGAYPQDGPYDCISHSGLSKNILTVGAVNDLPGGWTQPSDVVMSSFSSWGPVDDGRIKPDIVTNGVALYSSDDVSNTAYYTLSGTSMAAPSAAGSLILLQEHFEDLNGTGNFMKAATLKALVISTADEAGSNDGPDYSYGWGLMNTETAALKITEDQNINVIDELTLNNGGTFSRTVLSDGIHPLSVTICWTDLPGNPVSAQLDPSDVMLINDLDLRITQGGNTYYPWKLSRTSPAAAATNNSENNVDNVEMVFIDAPAGEYEIIVDHDGTLSSGSQDFSIIIDGITEAAPIAPIADFTASATTIFEGQSISFTDLSTNNPTSWSWTFTGGSPSNSTERNPVITYPTDGIFSVSLTATNSAGTDTETKTNYITVNVIPAPVANFSADQTTIFAGQTVNFTDLSTNAPTSWSWTFTGGSPATSTVKNPSVIYPSPGTYPVSLTATNAGGSDTETKVAYITVNEAPPVEWCDSYSQSFSGEYISNVSIGNINNTSGGSTYTDFTAQVLNVEAGQIISFSLTPWKSNPSRKESWRIWIDYNIDGDFTDPGELVFTTNRKRNAVNGSFTVPSGLSGLTRMRVSMEYAVTSIGPCDILSSGEVEDYSVQIGEAAPQPPIADFSYTMSCQTAQFTDLSTDIDGTITSWDWNFGDGNTSNQSDPSHTYSIGGTYTVSLTVTDNDGLTNTTSQNVTTLPPSTYYYDGDRDGYGDPDESIVSCTPSGFYDVLDNTDCDDTNAAINPGATEVCDGIDNNCDGQTDEGVLNTYYYDSDGDNFGDPLISLEACSAPTDYVDNNLDCDDTNGSINPNATEICGDNVDNNCNGAIDEGCGVEYDPSSGNATNEWIKSVSLNGLTNSSDSPNPSGYEDFTWFEFNVNRGTSYTLSLTPGFSGKSAFEYWSVWIDFNLDGDFDESGERVVSGRRSKRVISTSISIPSVALGPTRMRVTMKRGSAPSSPYEIFSAGEVEDYTVVFTGGTSKSGTVWSTSGENSIETQSINVYPNPVDERLFVEIEGWEGQKVVRLIDLTGRTILMKKVSENRLELDLSVYPKGLYLLDVSDGLIRKHRKISIQ